MAVIAAGQHPAPYAEVANRIRSLEHSKFDALQHKDNVKLGAIFDEGLLWVDQDGSLRTKAEGLANLHTPNPRILNITIPIMSVKVFGEVAVVVGIYEERGTKSGHPYAQRCRFIDTWALKKGNWICIATAATSAVS